MTSRNFPDWLQAYVDYASYGEAPRRMHFWCGVSAVAGALRRKTWLDMAYFKWYPNFYVILVAPPGIVSKSTTAGISMNLLRSVPGVRFGPDVVTWQALVKSLAESTEAFEYGGQWIPMSAVTIESSELGNLLNPHDREMVDLLITLWDGKSVFTKVTKMSGNDTIQNPWINIVACTTPHWIAANFPEYMVGGGFTSRCLFVYAEEKERYVPYPHLAVPTDLEAQGQALVEDLERIATEITGPYTLSPEALEWGAAWYSRHYDNRPEHLDDSRFGGYIARKQTHIHKLAMVISAARNSSGVITAEDLSISDTMVTDLEHDMPKVFSKIGKSEQSNQADQLIDFIKRRGAIDYTSAYRYVHTYFPDLKDFEGILAGAIKAGYIQHKEVNGQIILMYSAEKS